MCSCQHRVNQLGHIRWWWYRHWENWVPIRFKVYPNRDSIVDNDTHECYKASWDRIDGTHKYKVMFIKAIIKNKICGCNVILFILTLAAVYINFKRNYYNYYVYTEVVVIWNVLHVFLFSYSDLAPILESSFETLISLLILEYCYDTLPLW